MMNKEKYKQAFSVVHISDEFSLEGKNMKTASNKLKLNRLVACISVFVMIVGSATIAYAVDIGGIQRTIQLWVYGNKVETIIEFDGKGSYNMVYTDSEGNIKNQSGGGVSLTLDGTKTPATEEELMENLTAPDIIYEDDGTVFVYWFDQKIDITDKFDNDVCYVKLVNGDNVLYMTVKYQNGYITDPNKYPNPKLFN